VDALEGDFWTRINDPAVICLDEERADRIVWKLQADKISGAVRVIRGKKCGSKAALLDEVGAALQFPPYFGENWDALDECITDLDDWMPADWYLLHVRQIERVLRDDDRNFAIFIELLWLACKAWADPRLRSYHWEKARLPTAFNVLISGTAEGRRRAKAVLDRLEATSGKHETPAKDKPSAAER